MAAEQVAPLSAVPFDFWSGLIAAGFGLISGVIASLFAPWVHWFIERRRRSIEYQINLIANVRKLVDETDEFDRLRSSSFWGFIETNLSATEKKVIFPPMDAGVGVGPETLPRNERKKQIIGIMLSRLEIEWKLTKAPNNAN